MADLVTLQPVNNDPNELVNRIMQLVKDIQSCKGNALELKDRGWLSRLTSNNTKDIADVLVKQNDTLSLFFCIVNELIYSNLNNTGMLCQIQKNLRENAQEQGSFENQYLNRADGILDSAICIARTMDDRFRSVTEETKAIRELFVKNEYLDHQQTSIINLLVRKYKENEARYQQQIVGMDTIKKQIIDYEKKLKLVFIISIVFSLVALLSVILWMLKA